MEAVAANALLLQCPWNRVSGNRRHQVVMKGRVEAADLREFRAGFHQGYHRSKRQRLVQRRQRCERLHLFKHFAGQKRRTAET